MNGYSVKGLRTFATPDGGGYNVDLYRDGVKVAHAFEGGFGGEVELQFVNPTESKKFYDTIATLKYKFDGKEYTHSAETFIGELIEVIAEAQDAKKFEARIKRNCKKVIVVHYKEDGPESFRTFKIPYSAQSIAKVKELYGHKIDKVYNEEFGIFA